MLQKYITVFNPVLGLSLRAVPDSQRLLLPLGVWDCTGYLGLSCLGLGLSF
jgi:hypothetical protein